MTKFSLEQKVWINYLSGAQSGIIAGITIVDENNYLVIFGDDIAQRHAERQWAPESWLTVREKDES